MDKRLHPLWNVGWNYLSIPKLQRMNRWSLGMDKELHITLNWTCDYLSMLGLKLQHVSKGGPWYIDKLSRWFTEIIHNHVRTECIFYEGLHYCEYIKATHTVISNQNVVVDIVAQIIVIKLVKLILLSLLIPRCYPLLGWPHLADYGFEFLAVYSVWTERKVELALIIVDETYVTVWWMRRSIS